MGRPKVLTDYAKGFIEDMYDELGIQETANSLGISYDTVRNYLISKGMIESHPKKKRMMKQKEGCFDVHEREDWLTGLK